MSISTNVIIIYVSTIPTVFRWFGRSAASLDPFFDHAVEHFSSKGILFDMTYLVAAHRIPEELVCDGTPLTDVGLRLWELIT